MRVYSADNHKVMWYKGALMPRTSVFKQTISYRTCRASRSNANRNEFIIAPRSRFIQLYRDRRWCHSERVTLA